MNKNLVHNIARVVALAVLLGGSALSARQATEKSADNAAPKNGVYAVGNGVTAPKATYMPTAEFSEKARKKKIQGTVILAMVVTPEGNVRDVSIIKGVEKSLDQQAIAAVSTWKFEPGTKDGKPVAVQLKAEVAFRLR